jgi:hypothetical protein
MSSQMRHRPLLFVDIDGVLSLWGFDAAAPPEGRWTTVEGVLHFLSLDAAAALREVAGAYDCVWASGWEEKANDHLPRALGLGPWPHLDLDRRGRAGTSMRAHWKLGAVERHAEDRPLAWVDDAVDDEVLTWAAQRAAPTLVIEPHPASGLTRAHAAELAEFAFRWSGQAR